MKNNYGTRRNQETIKLIAQAKVFSSLADSLVGIFIPAFMLVIGYSLKDILLFMVFYSFVMVLNNFSTYIFNKKFGTRYSLFIGYLFQTILYIVLALNLDSQLRLLVMAICSGMVDGFLWSTRHFIVSISTNDKSHSKQLSKLSLIVSYMNIVGMLSTSIISKFFNPLILPWVAAISTIISALIVLKIKNFKIQEKLSINTIKKSVKLKEGLANLSFNIFAMGYMEIFSLYIFIKVNSLPSIASITLLASLVDIIINKIIGSSGDKGDNKKILKSGSILVVLSGTLLYLAQSIPLIIIINTLKSRLTNLVTTPWQALYYAKVKKQNLPYITTLGLELFGDSGRFIFMVILYFLNLHFGASVMFITAFILGGIATIPLNLMPDYIHTDKN